MFAERRVVRAAAGPLLTGRVRACAAAFGLMLLVAPRAGAQQLAGGVHVGGPVRASVAAGVLFQAGEANEARGVVALVEPGLRGGRVSLGYEVARGQLGTYFGARASVLRTWHVAAQRTYAGLELQLLPLFAMGGRLSAFVPTSGPHSVLWIADVSIGM